MDSTLTIPKDDPELQEMFSACKPGDEIEITLGYEGKQAKLSLTVGADDENQLTATVNSVDTADEGDESKLEEQEETDGAPGGKAGAASDDSGGAGTQSAANAGNEADLDTMAKPADYISKARKKVKK